VKKPLSSSSQNIAKKCKAKTDDHLQKAQIKARECLESNKIFIYDFFCFTPDFARTSEYEI